MAKQPPAHLRGVTGEQLWEEYRRNDCNLWCLWEEDFDNGLVPSMMEAAELLEEVEDMGGTIEINLDVTLPPTVEPIDPVLQEAIRDNGTLIKELLRFNREADYNLRELADT